MDQRSKKEIWIGYPIAQALGIDTTAKAFRKMVDGIKDQWIADGYLKVEKRPDAHRELRDYVIVGRSAVV